MATVEMKDGRLVDCEDAELVPHTLKQNKDESISAEVRIIVYLNDGMKLDCVRNVRFNRDEISPW